MMHKKTILFLLCVVTGSINAQSIPATETQVWFDITKFFPVTDELALGGDTGIRGFALDEDWTAIYIRPTLRYDPFSSLSFRGGVGFFYAFRDGPQDVSEFRPWAETTARWPKVGILRFQNRFRADFRYRKRQGVALDTFVLRLRYLFGTTIPIGDQTNAKSLYVPLSLEVMMDTFGDISARFINQSRFVAGLGYRISDRWRIELSYTRILLRLEATDPLRSRFHVFRIQIKG